MSSSCLRCFELACRTGRGEASWRAVRRRPQTTLDANGGLYYIMYYNLGAWIVGTRTVRLDEEAENTLARLQKATGLSISEVLKRGLQAYVQRAEAQVEVRPYDIYRRLDHGTGGWSLAPASDAKRAVKEALRRKIGR